MTCSCAGKAGRWCTRCSIMCAMPCACSVHARNHWLLALIDSCRRAPRDQSRRLLRSDRKVCITKHLAQPL